ncbi:hypothetical protein DXG01_005137 [Tephrocybe rancida]|nr:hypothetical protein DXG01_005137 [Tephrocybe rancida]
MDFYVREFLTNKTPSEIANYQLGYPSWIGSFEIALQFLLGIPVGIACDLGYCGSLIYCFSLFMVSLTQPGQYYQIFLAQSVGMGLGLALTFLPCIAVVSHHFERRRSLAIGIMTSGASIGGLVFPIMLNKLIFGRQGFALGVRATAAIITGLLVIANMLVRTQPRALRAGEHRLTIRRVNLGTLFRDVSYMTFVVSGVLLALGILYPSTPNNNIPRFTYVYLELIRYRTVFYLQLFSIKHAGINQNLAFYIVSFINTGGLFGRLIPNFLADRYGSYNILIPTSLLCSAVVFAILGIRDAAGAITVAIIYGAMNGARQYRLPLSQCQLSGLMSPGVVAFYIDISLTPAVLSDISTDVNEVGLTGDFKAAPSLFGQPISGSLLTDKFLWWRGTVFSVPLVLVL